MKLNEELDLLNFLEWLDTEGEVKEWKDDTTTHEEVIHRYIAYLEEFEEED